MLKLGTIVVDIDGNTTGLKQAENVVEKSSKKINANLKNTDRAANDTTKALGGIGRRSGQAGIQIQQFVGQIQGGQNAMLAFSQQSADLGFVLGAPLVGAIVGIGATIAGVLLPSLFSSKDATEELEDAMKRLDDVAVETGDGVEVLSKKLIELAKKSQQAAKAEIQLGIVTALDAISQAAKGAQEIMSDVFNVRNFKASSNVLMGSFADLSDEMGLTFNEAAKLAGAIRDLNEDGSSENLSALQSVLDELSNKYGKNNKEVVKLAGSVREMWLSAETAKDKMKILESAVIDLDTAIEDTEKTTRGQVDAIDKYIKALEIQVGALGLTGSALAEYEADTIGATGADKAQIVALKEKVEAYEASKTALEKEAKARESAQKKLDQVRSSGLGEEGKIDEEYKRRLDALTESLMLEQLTIEEYDQLAIKAHEDRSSKITDIDKKRHQEQMALNQQALSSLASFHSSVTDLIQAAGKEGTAIAKAAFLAGKAIQVAQIIAATEVAAAQAGAVAAIGGPVSWFASQAGIRAVGYANAGIVAGLSVGQAFEQGGIVGGHSTTGDRVPARVNSGEMILTTRQQQKLFSMANGREGGGSSSPNVNIINNGAPIDVQSMSISKDEITLMIDNRVKAGQREINQSLATGRGDTFQSLQKGSRVERRL